MAATARIAPAVRHWLRPVSGARTQDESVVLGMSRKCFHPPIKCVRPDGVMVRVLARDTKGRGRSTFR